MKINVTVLGTAGSQPTKERNVTGVFLEYNGDGMLFDCGEGTQRQMKIAGIPITKVKKIFITHWHGDHILGLPGLIQSLGLNEFQSQLDIYGPPGTKKFFGNMFHTFLFDQRIDIQVHEIRSGVVFDGKDYSIETRPLKHRAICYGYVFKENDKRKMNVSALKKLGIPTGPLVGQLQSGKTIQHKGKKITPDQVSEVIKGKKFAFVTDTLMCKGAMELAQDADVLLCESTYHSDMEDKAEDYTHLTAQQAAQIASQSDVKKLVLTHFSARYKHVKELEDDAKVVFPNTVAARDLMKISI